jgi:hypothetical protein
MIRVLSDARRREIVIDGRMVSITEVLNILRRPRLPKQCQDVGNFKGRQDAK